ncbi:MAG: type II toxin-antitoxin system HicA family toxin [Verrucomicrobiales bacterium]|nr:type II toxin-antitoxin system HicA family toxin [Verrucomicrobiales bacterium]
MKRSDLERHLRKQGCGFLREGGRHAIWWNPENRKVTSIPRHREINDFTAKKICRDLEIASF